MAHVVRPNSVTQLGFLFFFLFPGNFTWSFFSVN
uniref:Uncharacterized protein n=1 Tax=Anguilla anguilla TaxID=7936 RepID=A0A0E9T8N1_ANGAN